jgi:hypothetical protein
MHGSGDLAVLCSRFLSPSLSPALLVGSPALPPPHCACAVCLIDCSCYARCALRRPSYSAPPLPSAPLSVALSGSTRKRTLCSGLYVARWTVSPRCGVCSCSHSCPRLEKSSTDRITLCCVRSVTQNRAMAAKIVLEREGDGLFRPLLPSFVAPLCPSLASPSTSLPPS